MFAPNIERRQKIEELYLQGYTIDEIDSITGIPRSSVGRYVRKLRLRNGKKEDNSLGPNVSQPTKTLSNYEAAFCAKIKIIVDKKIKRYLDNDDPEKACAYLDYLDKHEKWLIKLSSKIAGLGEIFPNQNPPKSAESSEPIKSEGASSLDEALNKIIKDSPYPLDPDIFKKFSEIK